MNSQPSATRVEGRPRRGSYVADRTGCDLAGSTDKNPTMTQREQADGDVRATVVDVQCGSQFQFVGCEERRRRIDISARRPDDDFVGGAEYRGRQRRVPEYDVELGGQNDVSAGVAKRVHEGATRINSAG